MKHLNKRFIIAGLLLTSSFPVWANTTGGCVDSPENATLLLVLLGGTVAGLPWLRKRWAARRARHHDPARLAF